MASSTQGVGIPVQAVWVCLGAGKSVGTIKLAACLLMYGAYKKLGGFDALQELSAQSKNHRDDLSYKTQNSDA